MNSVLTEVLSRGIADGRQLARGIAGSVLSVAILLMSMNRPREITDNRIWSPSSTPWKSDAVHWVSFADDAELVRLLHGYIPYYNGVRLHSGIGYSSPVDYEARTT